MDILSIIESSGLFSGIGEDSIAALAKKCELKIFEDGEIIFNEGDIEPRGMYLIAGGEVILTTELVEKHEEGAALERRDFFLTSIRAGDSFGEISILDSGPRSAKAAAHGITTVCFISEAAILEISESDYKAGYLFTKSLARLVCGRLREADFSFKYKDLLR